MPFALTACSRWVKVRGSRAFEQRLVNPVDDDHIVSAGVDGAVQLRGRTDCRERTRTQNSDPVAQLPGFIEEVRRQDNGLAAPANQLVAHESPDRLGMDRVDGAGGLIEQQHRGIGQQCPRDRQPLAHSRREVVETRIDIGA